MNKNASAPASHQDSDVDVLIVGAGPTGLVLAAELLRHGVTACLIDSAAGPSELSRAVAVHARSLEMFDDMGMADRLIAVGTQITRFNVFAGNQRLVQLDMDRLEGPFPYILGVSQAQTEAVLREQLEILGLETQYQTKLVSLTQTPTGVNADIQWPDGQIRPLRCRWLVGCDGAHSRVRKAVNIAFEGEQYPESFLLADLHLEWPQEQLQNQAFAFLHQQGPLLIFPLQGTRYRVICASAQRDLPKGYQPSLIELQQIVSERAWPGLKLQAPDWMGSFKIHHRYVEALQAGRVLLAGDAAHIHSPVGGQGMNTSMQDAYNLGWKLALVLRGLSPESLLATYQQERLTVARQLVRETDLATRAITLHHPVAQQIRNGLLALLGQRERIRKQIRKTASELAIHYPNSDLNTDHWEIWGGGIKAGDRMPDFKLNNGNQQLQLFDLLRGPHHSLFLSGNSPELLTIQTRIHQHFSGLISVFWLEQAPDFIQRDQIYFALDDRLGLKAGNSALYLVRPDGYVGCRSQPAMWQDLAKYLQKVFILSKA